MIKPDDLRERVIRPTLEALAEYHPLMNTEAAVELLMGTAAQESDLGYYLDQIGGGPGLGIYQMEPDTHDSLWEHFIGRRPDLASIVRGLASQHAFDSPENRHKELITNLAYATAMARIKYWPKTEPLPKSSDIWGLGSYWNRFFNANDEHGTDEEFVMSYRKFVKGGF